MKIGSKVFIDDIFKKGYIYNFDDIMKKYRIACVEDGIVKYYDVYENKLFLMN